MREKLNVVCSAYRAGQICDNGFPTNVACLGMVCFSCGRPTDKTPACLNEDLPARWFDDSGLPRFTRHSRAALNEARNAD
jgi:hypothetical protein